MIQINLPILGRGALSITDWLTDRLWKIELLSSLEVRMELSKCKVIVLDFWRHIFWASFCICIPDVRGYIARVALLPLTSNQRLCLPDQTSFSSMLFVATSSCCFLFPCLPFIITISISWLDAAPVYLISPSTTNCIITTQMLCLFFFPSLPRYIFSDPEMITCIENLE